MKQDFQTWLAKQPEGLSKEQIASAAWETSAAEERQALIAYNATRADQLHAAILQANHLAKKNALFTEAIKDIGAASHYARQHVVDQIHTNISQMPGETLRNLLEKAVSALQSITRRHASVSHVIDADPDLPHAQRRKAIAIATGCPNTARKADQICNQRGYTPTGVILMHKDGTSALVNQGAVRWLQTPGELWDFISGSTADVQSTEKKATEG